MNLIIFALLGMLGVFGAVFSKLLADEFKAWAPSLVAHIIAAAVRKLPAAKRERFSEEWKSHVNEVPGDISKIAAACGCLFAAWKIAEAGPFDARKRTLDLAFATCALMGLIPLFFIVLLGIAASSPGPILFRQTRIGRDGKPFQALKFRTMHVDADNRLREYLVSNPEAVTEWKVTRRLRFDPRFTAIGSYLRKSSLDELPQLYNVLVGDISFVGPRSSTVGDFGKQTQPDYDYTAHKPGLTGFWQFENHSENTAYTRNWSPMLDVKIMLATIAMILRDDRLEEKHFEENYRLGLGIVLSVLALLGAIFGLL
jgi:lipopolysaccharide/colanic/teichoic acid biosynthesis glycosyltransferase